MVAPEHHNWASELVETVVEPRAGGAMYDVGADGSTCRWGTYCRLVDRPEMEGLV